MTSPKSGENAYRPEIRQVLCVPPSFAFSPASAQVQDIHVLLETCKGRLIKFAIAGRNPPELEFLRAVAKRLDEYDEPPGFEVLADRLRRLDHIRIAISDDLIVSENCWGLDQWSSRAIAAAIFDPQFNGLTASQIRASIGRNNASWLSARVDAFVAGLAVDLTRIIGALRPSVYNYLNAACPVRRRNRMQALELFPIFLPHLSNREFADICRVIDEGKPLIDALARKFITLRPVVESIRGTAVLAAGSIADQLWILMQLLRDIPVNWLPRSVADWQRLAEAVRHIETLSGVPILTTANRLSLRELARSGYRMDDKERAPQTDVDEWWRVGQEMDDLIRSIQTAIIHDLSRNGVPGNHEVSARRQTDLMLLRLGMKRVGRIARRWGDVHRRAQAEYEANNPVTGAMQWPLLATEPIAAGGMLAWQLADTAALITEGTVMSNCVSTYVHQCMTGVSQIWSIKSSDGTRQSTLETAVGRRASGGYLFRVRQHAGPRNSRPSPQAVIAVGELRRILNLKQDVLCEYVKWWEMNGKTQLSSRRFAAAVGVIIKALDEVLPQQWRFEELIRRAAADC